MYKIMSAQEAVGLIEDGDVIALNSFLGIDIPVELHCEFGRELMVQLMPDSYKDIEIMLDYANEKIIKLGDITPKWWINYDMGNSNKNM